MDKLYQFRYNCTTRPVIFVGDALDRLRDFPEDARRSVGFQIDRLQRGLDPDDWKPMKAVGPGVREIRVREASGAWRAIYVTTIGDAVHVLHAFQKKTQATPKRDLDLAARRFRELREEER